jgi:3-(3-hydroxy-phenyl)propionate hydroxylase
VSPFGARGGNSGIQDADNLAWKLALVLDGTAPSRLLDSYDSERRQAADENILNSTRATDFISPKGPGATVLRDAVLDLAAAEPFARRFLNSGRLSLPTSYDGSPLNGCDGLGSGVARVLRPGAPPVDAPLGRGWLLDELGQGFTVLSVGGPMADTTSGQGPSRTSADVDGIPVQVLAANGREIAERYGASNDATRYLMRPDQHVAARWRGPIDDHLRPALRTALARS